MRLFVLQVFLAGWLSATPDAAATEPASSAVAATPVEPTVTTVKVTPADPAIAAAKVTPADPAIAAAKATPVEPVATDVKVTPGTCESDNQCPSREFCNHGVCQSSSAAPWHIRWHRNRTTYTVVGPYVSLADRRGSTTTFMGLVWHWKDYQSKASTTVGFPLFIWHKAPREQGGIIGPGFGYRDDKGWLGGFFPLLFLANRDGRSMQVIPPLLFGHTRDLKAGTSTTVVGPLFIKQQRDGWDAGCFPILFAGKRADRTYTLIPPLYYYQGGKNDATHVFGPFYYSRNAKSLSYGLAPIIHIGGGTDGHLRWFLPPLYFHKDSGESAVTLIGPFFAGERPGARAFVLYPLFWYGQKSNAKAYVIPPLFAYVKNPATGTHNFWLGPYVHLHNEQRKVNTNVFFPLVVDHQEPGYHVTVQFPFFWRVRDGSDTTTVAFPFYLRTRRENLKADIAFPLVWRFATKEATTTVVGPVFWQHDRGITNFGVFPAFGGGWGKKQNYVWIPPLLLWHSANAETGKQLTIVGPFFRDRTPTSWTAGLIPLVFTWRRGPVTSWLAPLFFFGNDQENEKAAGFFGPLFFGRDHATRYGGLAPLFFHISYGDSAWQSACLPLFYASKKAGGERLAITLLGGVGTYGGGARGYLGPIYFRSDRDGWGAGVFPLFYADKDRRKGTETTFLLPLLLRRNTPESSLLGVTPLFWHYRDVESSTTVGFPFYYDVHAFFDTRTTVFFPVGMRHKNYATNSTTWLWPLLYVNKSPVSTQFVVYPLIWRIGVPGENGTAVFPLFWDFRKGDGIIQMFLPIYVFVRRPTADHIVVLNTYYRKGRGPREGSYSFHFIPLFDFGRPNRGDMEWNLFEGLIGYSRIGNSRRLKLFYALEIPLASSKSSATSFFDPPSANARHAMY